MAYCTITDLTTTIGAEPLRQLTDDANSGAIVAAVVTEAITWADEMLDGFAGKRYTVPISPVPTDVKEFSMSLAKWKLFSRRRISDEVQKEYDATISILKMVAKGDFILGTTAAPVADTGAAEARTNINTTDYPRAFTNTTLKDYMSP